MFVNYCTPEVFWITEGTSHHGSKSHYDSGPLCSVTPKILGAYAMENLAFVHEKAHVYIHNPTLSWCATFVIQAIFFLLHYLFPKLRVKKDVLTIAAYGISGTVCEDMKDEKW